MDDSDIVEHGCRHVLCVAYFVYYQLQIWESDSVHASPNLSMSSYSCIDFVGYGCHPVY